MNQPLNRNEILRNVQTILTKHAVDLQLCFFSCSIDLVTLYGVLKKSPKGDFTTPGVMALCRELKTLRDVRDVIYRLDNWSIDSSLTSVIFMDKREEDEDAYNYEQEDTDTEDKSLPEDDIFL